MFNNNSQAHNPDCFEPLGIYDKCKCCYESNGVDELGCADLNRDIASNIKRYFNKAKDDKYYLILLRMSFFKDGYVFDNSSLLDWIEHKIRQMDLYLEINSNNVNKSLNYPELGFKRYKSALEQNYSECKLFLDLWLNFTIRLKTLKCECCRIL